MGVVVKSFGFLKIEIDTDEKRELYEKLRDGYMKYVQMNIESQSQMEDLEIGDVIHVVKGSCRYVYLGKWTLTLPEQNVYITVSGNKVTSYSGYMYIKYNRLLHMIEDNKSRKKQMRIYDIFKYIRPADLFNGNQIVFSNAPLFFDKKLNKVILQGTPEYVSNHHIKNISYGSISASYDGLH
jgi:hypothetical protein